LLSILWQNALEFRPLNLGGRGGPPSRKYSVKNAAQIATTSGTGDGRSISAPSGAVGENKSERPSLRLKGKINEGRQDPLRRSLSACTKTQGKRKQMALGADWERGDFQRKASFRRRGERGEKEYPVNALLERSLGKACRKGAREESAGLQTRVGGKGLET